MNTINAIVAWFDVPKTLLFAGFVLGLIAIFTASDLPLWDGAKWLVTLGVLGSIFKA